MEHGPLISIITPVRNGEEHVAVCLASTQAAAFTRAEHIICDGGSTDATYSLARDFSPSSKTTVSIYQIKDRSMTEGLNNSINLASGEWIMPLNIDDQYLPNVGNSIEAALASSDADIAFFDVLIRKDLKPKYFQKPWLAGSLFAWDFMGCFVVECGVAMRRSSLVKAGMYNLEYDLAADFDMYRSLVKNGKSAYFPICIGVFNESGANLSHTMKSKILDEAARISRFGRFYAWLQDTRIDKLFRFIFRLQSYQI